MFYKVVTLIMNPTSGYLSWKKTLIRTKSEQWLKMINAIPTDLQTRQTKMNENLAH